MYRRDSAVVIFIECPTESKGIFTHCIDEYQLTFNGIGRNRHIYKSYCYYYFLVYSMYRCKCSDYKQEAALSMSGKGHESRLDMLSYEGYMEKLCTRTRYDLNGAPYGWVDEYMKRRL